MKNLKKVIALVAVLAMVLSTVALGATYTDVAEDSAYSTAVESLSKLGIVTGYEDGTYGPEKSVTRAEMAALIARIQGYGETAKAQTNTAFTDVPSSHWASGYVAYAANQKIVNGYGDGTFGPDDTVKYEQAVTMIMRTLGFEYFATTNGGYPTGYLAAATRYGLTGGVSNAVVGSEANRGTIAQLLYNGIDTPIMAPYAWNTNGEVEYAVYDGSDDSKPYKTLMSENLGVVKIKGVVVENKTTAINDDSKALELDEEEIVKVKIVDSYDSTNDAFDAYEDKTITELENGSEEPFTFLVGESDIADFLGQRVVLYAVEDKNIDEFIVVSAALDSTSNKKVEFTVDQFAGISNAGKVKYLKNATDSKATELIVDGAAVVFNNVGGKTLTDVLGNESAYVTPNCQYGGKVTLIDNNSTNGYDVIFVELGATAVVEEVNENEVVFKEAAVLATTNTIDSLVVYEDVDDELYEFYKDGEKISLADLKEWDVLTIVAADNDAAYITAEVINSTVSGAITATASSDTSANGAKYTIDGKKYDVALGNYKAASLQVGDAGIFYIDKYGKIAAFVEDATVAGGTAGNYGYVLYAAAPAAGSMSGVVQAKMITANGVETFDCATKVKFYVTTTSTNYDADDAALATAIMNNQSRIVKYTVNSNGEINAIYQADYNIEKLEDKGAVSGAYDADNYAIGGTILDENATVFLLTTNAYDANAADGYQAPASSYITGNNNMIKDPINLGDGDKYYKINTSSCVMGTLSDLADKEYYTGRVYLDPKGETGNILVITTGYGATAASSSIAVITDVAEGKNDNYEQVNILSYYADGELKENVYTTGDAYDASLTEGDIVKINVSSAGLITSIKYAVDFSDGIRDEAGIIDDVVAQTGNEGVDEDFAFGYATAFTKGTKTVTIGGSSYRLENAENVYVIEPALKANRIRKGSASNFTWDEKVISNADREAYADYVFVRKYKNRVEDVVIIKTFVNDYKKDSTVVLDTQADITAAKAAADTAVTAAETAVTTAETKVAAAEAAVTAAETKVAAIAAAKTAYEDAKATYDAAEEVLVGSGDADAVNTALAAYKTAAADAVTAAADAVAKATEADAAIADAAAKAADAVAKADAAVAMDSAYDVDAAADAEAAADAAATAADAAKAAADEAKTAADAINAIA